MPLPTPRKGEAIGFHVYPSVSDEGTLGDPETIIWSSIRQICSRSVAEDVAARIHGLTRKRDRQAAARSVKLYVQQSLEFYEAARTARPNTAPLIYYYSFLNLAKAFCELRKPRLHQRQECYRHGLSWRPDPKTMVDPEKEEVSLTTRGMWHALWEALMHQTCRVPNPTRLRIRDLLSYCPEVSVEYSRAFGRNQRFLDLEKPNLVFDASKREAWIRFSVHRFDFQLQRVTAPAILSQIATPRSNYLEVKSDAREFRVFESAKPIAVARSQPAHEALREDVLALNAFTHFGRTELHYFLPVQTTLPLRLPQAIVLYTILFWLGSLVRYDPHSVASLMESGYWILIDGFMSQSRLWLLEQFEWAIYQTETTLWFAR